TICAMFALRSFFKNKLIDKAVAACTKSSAPVFVEDFKEKAGLDVRVIEEPDDFVDFLCLLSTKTRSQICKQ
ncbi:MAG: hypothetical protein IIX33_04910, partial [Oscillospiraceae bacterium]|nr:hypothetical protein [Oscillospiraceae bacterium]